MFQNAYRNTRTGSKSLYGHGYSGTGKKNSFLQDSNTHKLSLAEPERKNKIIYIKGISDDDMSLIHMYFFRMNEKVKFF